MNTKELTEAVHLLLDREDQRQQTEAEDRQRELHREHQQKQMQKQRMLQSIEVIKWCVVGITSVVAVSVIIVIMIVIQVREEAERIKGEVQRIQREAEVIREKIRHPLETIGGGIGRRIDSQFNDMLRGDSSTQ